MSLKIYKQVTPVILSLLLLLSVGCAQADYSPCSKGQRPDSSSNACPSSSASSSSPSSSSSEASSSSSASASSSTAPSSSSSAVSSSGSTSTPDENTVYQGIDVSVYQDTINFESVRADGIEAVYIRAGEGTDSTDERFETNYQKARAAGLKLGFYYFVTATSPSGARAQAERFFSLIQGKSYTMRPAMDYESYGSLSNAEINAIAAAFLERLEELTAVRPVIYSDAYRVRTLWESRLAIYPLWIADYSTGKDAPPPTESWSTWSGYQYSDAGKVNGIEDDVDLDLFKETILIA